MRPKSVIILSMMLSLISLLFAEDPVVSNVEARQLDFPSLMVEVTYDVEADSEAVWITLRISDDGGETWDVPVRNVEGDIGQEVEVGEGKQILWNAGEDFPDQDIEDVVVRVIADDMVGVPDAGTERDFELIEDVWITMIWIPHGSFMMGALDGERDAQANERPRHRVTFEEGFWMGKYEVTQSQWEAVMENNPGEDQYGDQYGVGDDYPVYYVSWNDIQGFEEHLEEGFRLPSEAEWEYACRAGTETRFYWGDDNDYEEIGEYAWYSLNSDARNHNVGQKEPNPWGLYDMSGHVWEWCEDHWHGNYEGAPDNGRPWLENQEDLGRVYRGGSHNNSPPWIRSAIRGSNTPSRRHPAIGFRLVLDTRDQEEE